MLAVADVIEYFDRVNMDTAVGWADPNRFAPLSSPTRLWEDCGTVGCIAGWTAAWAGFRTLPLALSGLVQREFGISPDQADRLVYGYDDFWAKHGIDGPRTSKNAVKVANLLRRIANGEVPL